MVVVVVPVARAISARLRPSWAMSRSVRSRADSRCNKASNASMRSRFSVSTKTGDRRWLDRKTRTSAASVRGACGRCRRCGEAKEPGLEQGRLEQPRQAAQHFDQNLLAQIVHRSRMTEHGIDEARQPRLISDDQVVLRRHAAGLRLPDQVGQRGRIGFLHVAVGTLHEGRTVSGQESCVFCTVRNPAVSGEKNLGRG